MKKALLFLSLFASFCFQACNDKSDEEEIFSISYDVVYYGSDAPATDIVIFELDEKRNVVNKQTIPYIPKCGIDAEHITLNTTSDVVQVEVYHKEAGRYYFTYWDFRKHNVYDVSLSDNQITQEQYTNATR